MSVAWPDSIEDDVKAALDTALHAVFDRTIPDPHERGETSIAQSADVDAVEGGYLVRVHVSMPFQKYLDATDAGEPYLNVDDDNGNPGMVVYHVLRDHGIPVPENDPKTGVLFDRQTGTVEVQTVVDPADFSGGD